jgi:hypothetical protein
MVAVVPEPAAEPALAALRARDVDCWVCGEIA